MRDLILFIFLIAGTYLFSAGFAIVMFRLFFPMKTKEVVEESTLTLTYSKSKTPLSTAKSKMHLSVGGRR